MNALNKREIDRLRLEEESVDISFMEQSLERSKHLSTKIVSILDSFDQRLVGLESSILPIHNATQKLSRMYDHVHRTIGELDLVLSYFDMSQSEEALLNKGPQEANLQPYLDSMEKVKRVGVVSLESNRAHA